MEVTLTKGSVSNLIGLTLEGDYGAPVVKETAEGGVAALSERIRPGIRVLEVNGRVVDGHEEATNIIRGSSGQIHFKLAAPANDANETWRVCERGA